MMQHTTSELRWLSLNLVMVLLVLLPLCLQEKAQAQAFANALSTIGKFALKKKAGDKDQLFGR
jgi:hypothetical protein